MIFSDLYGTQLDIELGSADRTQLFTTARRKKAILDGMHNFERTTSCTPAYGSIALTQQANSAPTNATTPSAAGAGYSVNDVLTVVGGTNTVAAQFKVTALTASGVKTLVVQTAGAYTVLPTNPVAVTGGGGTGATLTVSWAGVAEYDLLANFSGYISLLDREEPSIKMVDSSGNISYVQGNALPRRTPHMLDVGSPGWRADPSGTPNGWYLRNDTGKTYLGFDPPPVPASGWTWTALVPYLSQSTDMSADSDQPFTVGGNVYSVLVPYHQALVHYAAGVLEPLRKGYSAAKRQMDLYAGYIAQYETKKRRDGANTVTYKRNYFRDAGRGMRPVDPHRWP